MSTIFNDKVVITDEAGNVVLEFNNAYNGNYKWMCDLMDGWTSTPDLNVALAKFGASDGAVPTNRFPANEKYVMIGGAFMSTSREVAEAQRDALVSAMPAGEDFYIGRYEGTAKRMRVRLAGPIEFPDEFEDSFRWQAPLVAPYPFKESLFPKSAYVNTYAGGTLYREYTGAVNGDTNYIFNPSFETDVNSNIVLQNGATVTRSSAVTALNGTFSARVTTAAQANSGIVVRTAPASPNSHDPGTWNGTISLRGSTGGEVIATWMRVVYTDGSVLETAHTNRTLTTSWQTFTHQIVPDDDKGISYFEVHARAPGTTSGVVYYVDLVHVNFGASASTAFTGTGTNAFWFSTPNLSPSGRQSNPKSPGKRSYTSFTRTYAQGVGDPENAAIESVDLVNNGNAVAYPITIVTGPLFNGGWEIRNETTNQRLSFRIDIPEGNELIIDHQRHTATISGQPVEFRKDGAWWGLAKGLNRVRLAADEFNSNATATFIHRDTWRN